MTPEERKLRAQLAAHKSWAKTEDRQARISKARSASPADVEWHAKRLDPNNELPEAERYRRAESERKAYFANLSLKAATAARHRREGKNG